MRFEPVRVQRTETSSPATINVTKPNRLPLTAASRGNRPYAQAPSFVRPLRDRTGLSERGTAFCVLRGTGALMEATRDPDMMIDMGGAGKAFGEQRAPYSNDEHRLKSVSVRICPRFPESVGRRIPTAWFSYPDSAHLTECGLNAPPAEHAVVYGVSKNDSLSRGNQPAAHPGRRPGDNAGNRRSELESPAEPHGQDDLTTAVHGCGFSAAGRCKD